MFIVWMILSNKNHEKVEFNINNLSESDTSVVAKEDSKKKTDCDCNMI